MSAPPLTALIRCRDEEAGIGALIDALREQSVEVEIVVVDSGSRDRTLEIVRSRGIDPVEIAPESFTFGHALNVAAERASASVCVAISAHALPESSGWAERGLAAFDDERVACAFGERVGPDLVPLSGPLVQDLAHAERHPFYGYSNGAGFFRRELWERHRFDERLPASEDKEWAWHWLREGWVVLLDPALSVRHEHDEGPLTTFRRARDCYAAEAGFRPVPAVGLREAAGEWWSGPHMNRSRTRARLDPNRLAMVAAKYAGCRSPLT